MTQRRQEMHSLQMASLAFIQQEELLATTDVSQLVALLKRAG